MIKKKKISWKRTCLVLALAAILTVSLMMSSTMAWFNDTAALTNTFTFGSIELLVQYQDENEVWHDLDAAHKLEFIKPDGTQVQMSDVLFEPGATFQVQNLRVVNVGDNDFEYKLWLEFDDATVEDGADLRDVLDWSMKFAATGETFTKADYQLLSANADKFCISDTIQILLHMQENAGNDYQNASLGNIRLYAVAIQTDGYAGDADREQSFQQGLAKVKS